MITAFHSRNSETEFPPKQHQIFKKKTLQTSFLKKKKFRSQNNEFYPKLALRLLKQSFKS